MDSTHFLPSTNTEFHILRKTHSDRFIEMASSSSAAARVRVPRQPNMRPFEDVAVCEEYVKATLDIENGTCQNAERLWTNIEESYNARSDTHISREYPTLQGRFSTISRCVSLWVAKLSQAYTEFRSGTNELNWVDAARALYQQANKGKAFTHDKCYEALKKLPKFQISTTGSINAAGTIPTYQAPFDTSSPGTPMTPTTPVLDTNLGDDIQIGIEPPAMRPPGRKGEKERQKRKARNSIVSTNNAMMQQWDSFNQNYVANAMHARESQEKFDTNFDTMVQARNMELAILQKKSDDDILFKDVSHMNEYQLSIWNSSVQEILQKRARSNVETTPSSFNPDY